MALLCTSVMVVSFLCVDKVQLVSKSQQEITGVSKHLCGAATGKYGTFILYLN